MGYNCFSVLSAAWFVPVIVIVSKQLTLQCDCDETDCLRRRAAGAAVSALQCYNATAMTKDYCDSDVNNTPTSNSRLYA